MSSNNPSRERKTVVVDASGAVLGRIASYAAKQSLLGKNVVIVNCKKALITGKKRTTIREYNDIRQKGGSSLKGPFFPKNPERIVKRTARGMLSHQQQRGIDAHKRIMCYNDVPVEFASATKVTFNHNITARTTNLEELSREI